MRSLHQRPHRRRKSASWAPPVEVDASLPCWPSRARWLEALEGALETTEGRQLRATVGRGVGQATVLSVARVDAGTANKATGRGVRTSHETVARDLGRSRDTVKYARQVIERLGYAVVVEQGRRLSAGEREEALTHHGNHQRNIASSRVLTTPRPQALPPLPRRGPVRGLPHQIFGSPKRANARAARSSTTPQTPVARRKRTRTPARCPQSYDRGLQVLAAKLALRVPWLGRGHLGALCQVLATAGVDPARWDAAGLVSALDQRNRELRWDAPVLDTQHRRLRLLAHQLGQVLPAYTDALTPTEAAWERRRQATARAAERTAEAEQPAVGVSPAEDNDLRERLEAIRAEAAVQATAEQARRKAERDQAEADKAERAARVKADREAAGVGPVVGSSRGEESQAEKIVRQKSRWQRLGVQP